MKLKPLLCLFTLIGISVHSFAEKPTHKEQVFQIVKEYALATSCMTTFEKSEDNNFGNPDPTNEMLTYTTTENVHLGMNKYFVLWGGVNRCDIVPTGGNYSYNLTALEYSEMANRFIIKDFNIITDVKNESFFTLSGLNSIEQLDDKTYKLGVYMFSEKDLDSKYSRFLKDNAKPKYYSLTIVEDYSDGFHEGYFNVVEKHIFN